MNWDKVQITREGSSEKVFAQAPIIISASRSTDIPAFYADWFFKRMEIGYSAWTNPFNGVKSFVSYGNTHFIVFWSKNPRPLIPYLGYLEERKIGTYIQYSLNDYEQNGLERGVPPLQYRIDSFKMLVDRLGLGSVIWRFDPMILTDEIHPDELLGRVEKIGDQLKGYTEKLVFSYADIASYRRVKANLEKNNIRYHEWTLSEMDVFAQELAKLNEKWGYTLATCGEKIDLERYHVSHNKCIDDDLIIRRAYYDAKLMKFLGVQIVESGLFGIPDNAIALPNGQFAVKTKNNKDNGQRAFCGCIASKDIGEYNTCAHQCEYCYANTSKQSAIDNLKRHRENPYSETIIGI